MKRATRRPDTFWKVVAYWVRAMGGGKPGLDYVVQVHRRHGY